MRAALQAAAEGIEDFHRHQVEPDRTYRRGGVVVEGLHRPVDRAGCYVPGGRARYPTTVLMTAVPGPGGRRARDRAVRAARAPTVGCRT